MRGLLLLTVLALVGCDAPKSDGESEDQVRPLREVCEEFCPDYFACHDDDSPVEVCVETCVSDGEGEPECEAAVSRFYQCRFDNLCDGDPCPEDELDAICGDDA